MKRINLLSLLFLLFTSIGNIIAQEKQTVVTLKSGTEMKGVIKSIDPTNELIFVIGGVETTIKMADVARIEEQNEKSKIKEIPQLSRNTKYVVTDFEEYPDSFNLEVCDHYCPVKVD